MNQRTLIEIFSSQTEAANHNKFRTDRRTPFSTLLSQEYVSKECLHFPPDGNENWKINTWAKTVIHMGQNCEKRKYFVPSGCKVVEKSRAMMSKTRYKTKWKDDQRVEEWLDLTEILLQKTGTQSRKSFDPLSILSLSGWRAYS